jgi:hypothetical protein
MVLNEELTSAARERETEGIETNLLS